jgi:hypothetical protein
MIIFPPFLILGLENTVIQEITSQPFSNLSSVVQQEKAGRITRLKRPGASSTQQWK